MGEPAKRIKVAIVGGGCAGLSAAHALTQPEQGDRFEVTVYQQGWRLGGKGASGRGPAARIEEHGLHIWMGFYENAFRLMRSVYSELARDPAKCPIADWTTAFCPSSHVGLASSVDANWTVWSSLFPPLPGEPGSPLTNGVENPFTIQGYVVRACGMMRALFDIAYDGVGKAPSSDVSDAVGSTGGLVGAAQALASSALGAVDAVAALVENQLTAFLRLLGEYLPAPIVATALDLGRALLEGLSALRPTSRSNPHRQRAGEVLEISVAAIVGILREGVLSDPHGFDVLDEVDFIDWLRGNGLSDESASSPFLLGLYSLMFAYEGGDPSRPRVAAGQAIRGCLRMFFTYRGAFFWKMQAGMGDVVFAPLYEVLTRRGVRFEFFHRLQDVKREGGHVARLDFLVQAEVIEGRRYEPLVDVHGLPSWPSRPDWSQLVNGSAYAKEHRRFESHWDDRHVRTRSLAAGVDFDLVVVAVGGGAIPHVCQDLIEHDARWRQMSASVATVATQALQIWTRPPMTEFGWTRGPITMTAFVSPFDTWSDMTHLLPAERWPADPPVRGLAYFCNVLDERDVRRCYPEDGGHQARVDELVRDASRTFIARELPRLWPALEKQTDAFVSVYSVGNVNPTDRYVQTLPGTTKFRISPLEISYDNLTVAGDWTNCGLSVGCVESAVMSGLLASHALSGQPALESIVGYDHP